MRKDFIGLIILHHLHVHMTKNWRITKNIVTSVDQSDCFSYFFHLYNLLAVLKQRVIDLCVCVCVCVCVHDPIMTMSFISN